MICWKYQKYQKYDILAWKYHDNNIVDIISLIFSCQPCMCPCGEIQTMSHIVESCPLTKLNAGLSRLHSADENAVSWLTNYNGSWHAYEKKKTLTVGLIIALFLLNVLWYTCKFIEFEYKRVVVLSMDRYVDTNFRWRHLVHL